jgi:hypothetical protein
MQYGDHMALHTRNVEYATLMSKRYRYSCRLEPYMLAPPFSFAQFLYPCIQIRIVGLNNYTAFDFVFSKYAVRPWVRIKVTALAYHAGTVEVQLHSFFPCY